jgi:hypothetical protein
MGQLKSDKNSGNIIETFPTNNEPSPQKNAKKLSAIDQDSKKPEINDGNRTYCDDESLQPHSSPVFCIKI